MTSPQERIAIAIGNFAHAMETNNAGSTKLRLETREELHALFAELAAERDAAVAKCAELERMLGVLRSDLESTNAALAAAKQAMESLGYLTGHVGHCGDHDVLTVQVNAATAQRWNRAYQAIAAAEQGGA